MKNGSPGWICPTYYTEGKEYCQSKKIPEEALKAEIKASLGIDTWLPDVFLNQVEYIVASGPNTIELHMMDGSIRSLEWKDRSRRDSWTPEMRAQAAEHAKRRYHG